MPDRSRGQRDRDARARARASMPGRVVGLADKEVLALAALTPSERMDLVAEVTLDAWASSGKQLPGYQRQDMPGALMRGGGDEA